MQSHVFTTNHRRSRGTFKKTRLRAIAAGLLFVLASPAFSQTVSTTWLREQTPNGWMVYTPNGGTVYLADKYHKWNGNLEVDVTPMGAFRLKVPNGWIVANPKGGAAYVADSSHVWTVPPPVIIPEPSDLPTPSPSPSPSATPEPSASPTPSATPEPTPPTPSGALIYTKPTSLQGLKETTPGIYESVDFPVNKAAVVHFNIPEVTYGDTVIKTFTRQSNLVLRSLPTTARLKVDRNWISLGGYPNTAEGSQADYSMTVYTEKLPVIRKTRDAQGNKVGPWTSAYYSFPSLGDNSKEVWERTYKLPSGPGKSDGRYTIKFNGRVIFDQDQWQCDDAANPGIPNLWLVQDVLSGATPPAGTKVTFSEIKIEVVKP